MTHATGTERPKRLEPTKLTIRQIALLSGNLCAFAARDECDRRLINEHDEFVGQVAHIQGALPSSARFNSDMSNEQRRHPGNLMLLCYEHHIETNNEQRWPTDRMKELKASHEKAHRDDAPHISEKAITDITESVAFGEPQTALSFLRFTDPDEDLTDEHHRQSLHHFIKPLLESLRKLAPETRELLLIALERSTPFAEDLGVPADELEQVTHRDSHEIQKHVDTMQRYGIARIEEDYFEDRPRYWFATMAVDGWGIWQALKEYCDATEIDLADLVRELRFDLLD